MKQDYSDYSGETGTTAERWTDESIGMSDAQSGIDANTPGSTIERLLESELIFNIIAPVFSILFVTGLALWAATGFLRDPISRNSRLPRSRDQKYSLG